MNEMLLQELVEAHGIASREERIREIVRCELGPLCEIRVDTMGNMICRKPPTTKAKGEPRKLMIAAHMDEIGFVVKHIDSNGFLRLNPVGGWDARQMASQRVFVHTAKGDIPGVLMQSTKPKHLLKPEDLSKAPVVEDFFVDVGMSKKEADKAVQIGDWVTMNRTLQRMGKLFTCKAMDDRIAVYVMIEALKAVKNHQVEVYAVATVQEEVGLRGATASGWSIQPDICVAIDVTLANDIPGISEPDYVTQ
ncbi:MAG: endoglucanase, partial [Armatimonadota bacterium]